MTAVEPANDIVDQVLDQLEPIIGRQRKALVEQGCFRQVSSTHLHALYLLASHGPMTMSRLADHLDVSLPNATGLIERMFERGIVERVRPEDDRRVVEVRITATGRDILDRIDMVKRQQMADVISRLTPEQQQRALRTFTEMRGIADQLTREEIQTKVVEGAVA
ncbi:MAG TPA: MarR family transcriptional regulator [Candidatus Limnocylindrales bacterium]|jgi:DNA-binding MarR family transcriptional regulator